MMVGAPKARDLFGQQNKTSGVVYKCLFKGGCKKLKVDNSGWHFYRNSNNINRFFVCNLDSGNQNLIPEWQNALLGSSMDMSSDRFVVCKRPLF
jgi:hypothetical protein